MWSRREEVDYALQRRNTLQALKRPQRSLDGTDVCDADPLLVRAALHHGEESARAVPGLFGGPAGEPELRLR